MADTVAMSHILKKNRRREEIARAMTALSHPRRVAIFESLLEASPKPISFETLLENTSIRRSSLAHHLRPMENAGLVRRRRQGVNVVFALHGRAVRNITENVASRIPGHEAPQAEERRSDERAF